MEILALLLLLLVFLVGWITIFLGLPGTLVLLLAAALFAWPYNFRGESDLFVLLILFTLVVLAEGLEFLVTYFCSRKAKVPTDVTLVAIISGIVGALIGVPIAVIGSLVGMFVGIFVGTLLYSYIKVRDLKRCWQMAKASLLSRTLAIGTKALIGLIMIGYVLFKIDWSRIF